MTDMYAVQRWVKGDRKPKESFEFPDATDLFAYVKEFKSGATGDILAVHMPWWATQVECETMLGLGAVPN